MSEQGEAYDKAIDGVVKKTRKKIGDDETDEGTPDLRSTSFVVMLTSLLLVENYLKTRATTKAVIALFASYMPLFLHFYKNVVSRTIGMAMKISKFHLAGHHPRDIERFGPAHSWDSSNGESNHIGFKDAARHTQRNTRQLDQQTAVRHHESSVIDRAYRHLHRAEFTEVEVNFSTNLSTLKGCAYYVTNQGMFMRMPTNQEKKGPVQADWPNVELCRRVEEFVGNNILPNVEGGIVELFTQLKWENPNTIFRGNPSFSTEGKEWHDWCNVDWSNGQKNRNQM